MMRQQDSDGCFRRSEHNGVPHVYNTRAVWGMVATGILSGDRGLLQAAQRNLDWALSQQTACGWFATNAFLPGRDPFTHTIAYAIRGLLESGVLLGHERYIAAAARAARGLMGAQRQDGWLAGTYADNWQPTARYACVTGLAQMSLNWTRLAQTLGGNEFRQAAQRAVTYVKRTQRLEHPEDIVRGAIPGSAPLWGDYSRFEFPNWAAKFFADALMMHKHDKPIPPIPMTFPDRSR
jgi:hypothetical protein